MTLTVYSIDGVTPVVDPTAFVHPSAVLIGDVIVGAGCYIGPCASLRGDFGGIRVHAGANIQDSCIMHGFPGTDTIVEEERPHRPRRGAAQLRRRQERARRHERRRQRQRGDRRIGDRRRDGVRQGRDDRAAAHAGRRHAGDGSSRALTEQELEWKRRGNAELSGAHAPLASRRCGRPRRSRRRSRIGRRIELAGNAAAARLQGTAALTAARSDRAPARIRTRRPARRAADRTPRRSRRPAAHDELPGAEVHVRVGDRLELVPERGEARAQLRRRRGLEVDRHAAVAPSSAARRARPADSCRTSAAARASARGPAAGSDRP